MAAKYYHFNMAGAPALTGAAGSIIAILDACLKDGFGSVTMDSLTIAGGIGTLVRSSGITFERDAVIQLAGITGGAAALNGDRTLLAVTPTTATFDATGISNQTAAGTITAKMSPAGWLKPFSGTNLAVYKSSDVTAFGQLLRVDDTSTTNPRVIGYESMTDVNTGLGKFPTEVQQSGGGYWEKSSAAGATTHPWAVVADERFFYFWCVPSIVAGITSQGTVRGFGDLVPRGSTDNFATLLACDATNIQGSTSTIDDLGSSLATGVTPKFSSPRGSPGFGSAISTSIFAESRRGNGTRAASGGSNLTSPYPNTSDLALDLDRVYAYDFDLSTRGQIPGIYHCPQTIGFAYATLDKVDGQGALAGKRLLVLRIGPPGAGQNAVAGSYGAVFFDITGPWR